MAIRQIIQIGDKRLNQISEPIKETEFNQTELKTLISDLGETMLNEPDSAGISAPQIAVNKRLFLINNSIFNPNTDKKILVFINPKITKYSSKYSTEEEGCLSVRWQYGLVKRPKQIELEYQDETGVKHKQGFGGFVARVIQHEIDHLDGILFTSKATNLHKLSEEEVKELIASWEKNRHGK